MQPYGSFGHDGGKAGGFFLKAFLIFGFQVWFWSAVILVCGLMARLNIAG